MLHWAQPAASCRCCNTAHGNTAADDDRATVFGKNASKMSGKSRIEIACVLQP